MFRRFVPMIGLRCRLRFSSFRPRRRAPRSISTRANRRPRSLNDCGTCHKSAKGLANGKNSATLAGFLREHYTSSAQQAASLAAFVLGAGAGRRRGNLKPGTANPKPAKPNRASQAGRGQAASGRQNGRPSGRPTPARRRKQKPRLRRAESCCAGRKPAGKRDRGRSPRAGVRGRSRKPAACAAGSAHRHA